MRIKLPRLPAMPTVRSWHALLLLLALTGCAETGLMAGREPYWISEVSVRVPPNIGASPGFADRLRATMLDAAWRWSNKGAKKRLRLTVSRYQLFRTGRVMVHESGSFADARALLVDDKTGREEALVEITGVVRHPVGVAGRWIGLNQPVEEAGIAAAMADDLMRQLHGRDYEKAMASRPVSERRPAYDPIDGPPVKHQGAASDDTGRAAWDHASEMACLDALERALVEPAANDRLPAHCRVLGYRLPGK